MLIKTDVVKKAIYAKLTVKSPKTDSKTDSKKPK